MKASLSFAPLLRPGVFGLPRNKRVADAGEALREAKRLSGQGHRVWVELSFSPGE